MKTAIVLACTLALTACATVPPPSSGASSKVALITADQAKACKKLDVVRYKDVLTTVGKYPALMKATAETRIRDAAASVGANALVLTNEDSNFFWGTIDYAGDAYRCAA